MKTILEKMKKIEKEYEELAELFKKCFRCLTRKPKKSDDYNKEIEKGLSDFDKKDKE